MSEHGSGAAGSLSTSGQLPAASRRLTRDDDDMPTKSCTCEPWKSVPPSDALTAIAKRTTLEMGRSYFATFTLSGSLVGVRKLPASAERQTDRWKLARKVIAPTATKVLGTESPRPPTNVSHLIRCRDSRTVYGRYDYEWAYSLLYGLQMLNSFCGDLIVVTPSGWTIGGQSGSAEPNFHDLRRLKLAPV